MPIDIKQLKNANSFRLDTEALGPLKFRALYGWAEVELEKRFPDLAAAPNRDFIQVLASSVGCRISEQDDEGKRITYDEVGQLSDEELNRFAEMFLQNNDALFRDYEDSKTTSRKNSEGQTVVSTSYGRVDMPRESGETSTQFLQRVLADHKRRNAEYFSKTPIGMLMSLKDHKESFLFSVKALADQDRLSNISLGIDRSLLANSAKGFLDELFSFRKELTEDFIKSNYLIGGFAKPDFRSLFGSYDPTLPAFFEAAKAANFSAMRLLEEFVGQPSSFANPFGQLSKEWAREVSGGLGFEKVVGGHLAQITEMSIAAQASLAGIKTDMIGSALGLSFDRRAVLGSNFGDFSATYRDLLQSYESSHADLLSLPPSLSRLPTVEYFNGAKLLRATSIDAAEETEDEYTDNEIAAETEDELSRYLRDLDPPLVRMLNGARQALNSDNPDRVRHFSSSLRELFTHVLHRLAPDEEVHSWSNSPEHYHGGRPTRKARLLYINRGINQKPFDAFVEKDINTVVEFLKLFQQGTHEVEAEYTLTQLRALEARMHSTLKFLIVISQSK